VNAIARARPLWVRFLAWRWHALLYACLAVVAIMPLALVNMPGLGDYPNHLARVKLLADLGTSPVLQRYFEPGWLFAPYLGMDVAISSLSWLIGIYAAGRCFAALCLLMPVFAAMTLRAAFFGRVGLAPAAAFLVSYSYVFSRGFLDFLFSADLAIMAFAGWVICASRPHWWHPPAFSIAVALLYVSHAFAPAVFVLLVAGFEIERALRARPWSILRILTRWLFAASTILPTLAMVASLSPAVTVGTAVHTQYGTLAGKLGAFVSPFYFPGGGPAATLFAVVPFAGLAALCVLGVRRGAVGSVLVCAAAAACMPSVLFNWWGADFRLPVVLCVLAFGVCEPARGAGRGATFAAIATLCGLVGVRAASAAVIMRQADGLASETRQAIAALPIGSRLLVVQQDPPDSDLARMIGHYGMIAAIDRDALVPFLFCYATPLRMRADAGLAASPDLGPIDLAQLADGVAPLSPAAPFPPFGWGGNQYWRGWPAHFDYVLFLHGGTAPDHLPGPLRHLAGNAFADLYKIARP
jgi:hypothetical protein